MNYLAHAYLSFHEPEILVGNLISDFVKGKKKFNYPAGIRQGITLHRSIDGFTDAHKATREAKEIFRPYYRLYSGPFVDVLYDHYLAVDANEFSEQSLYSFSLEVYRIIESHESLLPGRFAAMFPHMKYHNWLFNYRSLQGTRRSLEGVVRRAAYLTESDTAFHLFEKNYQPLQEYYRQFWVDVKLFARAQLDMIKDADNNM